MKKLLIFFVIISCFNGVVFSQIGQDVDDGFSPLDAYYLGRAVAAKILSSYKIYNNKELTQYLNKICQVLAINSDFPTPYNGYFVTILDSNEFNAFATPGGHIFITKKMVESASSEDMLAAVIAHELAHVMLRHGIQVINESKFENEMSAMADMMAGNAAGMSAEAARAKSFRDSITSTVDTLIKGGYSQIQEYDADKEAVILLLNSGYDPNALIEILKVLQRAQNSQRGRGLYTTHPSPEHRIANLEGLKLRKNDTVRDRTQRFKGMKF
jgi:beta-barrel assembly-enhancing protease